MAKSGVYAENPIHPSVALEKHNDKRRTEFLTTRLRRTRITNRGPKGAVWRRIIEMPSIDLDARSVRERWLHPTKGYRAMRMPK